MTYRKTLHQNPCNHFEIPPRTIKISLGKESIPDKSPVEAKTLIKMISVMLHHFKCSHIQMESHLVRFYEDISAEVSEEK